MLWKPEHSQSTIGDRSPMRTSRKPNIENGSKNGSRTAHQSVLYMLYYDSIFGVGDMSEEVFTYI